MISRLVVPHPTVPGLPVSGLQGSDSEKHRPARLVSKLLRPLLLSLALVAGGSASAQLLAEVSTVAALSATLDPAIRLPSGSYRVTSTVPASLLNRVDGRERFGEWEAYTATGMASRLYPAHMHQLSTSFALAGYFQQSRSERQVGNETHVSQLFLDGTGSSVLLYTIETESELVWLIGRGY